MSVETQKQKPQRGWIVATLFFALLSCICILTSHKYKTLTQQKVAEITDMQNQFNKRCDTIKSLKNQLDENKITISENNQTISKLSTSSGIESIKIEYRKKINVLNAKEANLEKQHRNKINELNAKKAEYEKLIIDNAKSDAKYVSSISGYVKRYKKLQDELNRKNKEIKKLQEAAKELHKLVE